MPSSLTGLGGAATEVSSAMASGERELVLRTAWLIRETLEAAETNTTHATHQRDPKVKVYIFIICIAMVCTGRPGQLRSRNCWLRTRRSRLHRSENIKLQARNVVEGQVASFCLLVLSRECRNMIPIQSEYTRFPVSLPAAGAWTPPKPRSRGTAARSAVTCQPQPAAIVIVMRVIATAIIVIRIMIITILVVVIITKVIMRSICRRGLRTGDAVGVPETWRTRQPSISRPLAVMSFLTTTSNLDAIHNTVGVAVVFSLLLLQLFRIASSP